MSAAPVPPDAAESNTPAAAASQAVWINGTPDGTISPLDRGLHFGDGLFETIACRGGRARFLSLHLERLSQGCSRLRIPFEAAQARAQIEAVARGVDRALIKFVLTRGTAVARGYAASGTEKATRITIRYPWPDEDAAQAHDGVMVQTLALRLGENPLLAGLKHCNRLEQILARFECAQRQVSEGIVFSSSGRLVSGTLSNVFLVRSGGLLTPRMDRCGVAGVMRRVVIAEAVRAGITVQECELGAAELEAAQELFLTNVRIGIRPIRGLDSRHLAPGPVTRRLQAILAPLLEASGRE